MGERRRISDKFMMKFSKGTLISIIATLIGVVFFFVGQEYKNLCSDRAANATEHKVFREEITSLKVIMPMVLEELKSINKTLRRNR